MKRIFFDRSMLIGSVQKICPGVLNSACTPAGNSKVSVRAVLLAASSRNNAAPIRGVPFGIPHIRPDIRAFLRWNGKERSLGMELPPYGR
jgi:hypothetical protein